MAGMHVTGPVKVTGSLNGTTAGNEYVTLVAGSGTTSVLTVTGMVAADVVKAAYRVQKWSTASPTISNLTSVAVPGAGSVTLTGKTTGTSLVLVHWVDVSAAS